MQFLSDLKSLLTQPGAFFDKRSKKKDTKQPFMFYLTCLIIGTVLGIVSQVLSPSVPWFSGPIGIIIMAALSFIGGIVGPFISAGIIQFFAPRLGGKKGFYRTFNPLVYASSPVLLVNWLGNIHIFLGIIALMISILDFVLLVKGIRRFHQVSVGRAIILLLIPFLIIAAIAMIIGFAFVLAFIMPNIQIPLNTFN